MRGERNCLATLRRVRHSRRTRPTLKWPSRSTRRSLSKTKMTWWLTTDSGGATPGVGLSERAGLAFARVLERDRNAAPRRARTLAAGGCRFWPDPAATRHPATAVKSAASGPTVTRYARLPSAPASPESATGGVCCNESAGRWTQCLIPASACVTGDATSARLRPVICRAPGSGLILRFLFTST